MKKLDKFENQLKICETIQSLVTDNSCSYIEAAIQYSEDNNLEIEYVASMLMKNGNILSNIEIEAENLNFLKKRARLPFST